MAIRFDDYEEDVIVAEINITPLTDIFLVLLIIFMISSSAMLEGGLNVKLPSAHSGALVKASSGKPVFVTISKGGEMSVNDQITSRTQLKQVIEEALAKTSDPTVVIRGDESIFLGSAVEVMDAARSAGAQKIALATRPPEATSK